MEKKEEEEGKRSNDWKGLTMVLDLWLGRRSLRLRRLVIIWQEA
jgi:hypothetical protein